MNNSDTRDAIQKLTQCGPRWWTIPRRGSWKSLPGSLSTSVVLLELFPCSEGSPVSLLSEVKTAGQCGSEQRRALSASFQTTNRRYWVVADVCTYSMHFWPKGRYSTYAIAALLWWRVVQDGRCRAVSTEFKDCDVLTSYTADTVLFKKNMLNESLMYSNTL